MDNVELGAELKRIRKDELNMTQLDFVEASGFEIKKISRLECGYQLPGNDYFDALEKLEYDTTNIKRMTDDVKRRQHIIRRKHASPSTESMAQDIEQIKQVAANNNAILREILKAVRQLQSSKAIVPAQADLFNQALQPLEF